MGGYKKQSLAYESVGKKAGKNIFAGLFSIGTVERTASTGTLLVVRVYIGPSVLLEFFPKRYHATVVQLHAILNDG